MPRLSKDEWESVRAARETGVSFNQLGRDFGIDKAAIMRRAKKEGWDDGADVQDAIRRQAAKKVSGIVTTGDLQKKAEAIDAEAEKLAEIQRRHREEPNAVRERLYAGLKAHKAAVTREGKQLAFEDLKAAKIASETLLNIHKAERQAWDMDYPIDVKSMSIEQLEQMAKGKLPR